MRPFFFPLQPYHSGHRHLLPVEDVQAPAVEGCAPDFNWFADWFLTGAVALSILIATVGIDVRIGVGGTGVVGTLRGARPGRTVLLRADMDALPAQERFPLRLEALEIRAAVQSVLPASPTVLKEGRYTCVMPLLAEWRHLFQQLVQVLAWVLIFPKHLFCLVVFLY